MNKSIYGVPALTLTEAVEELMMLQNNDRQSHYLSYLAHARWAWKRLLWNTLWAVREEILQVDPVAQTVVLPDGIVRLVGLSVVDTCNSLQPLVYNQYINTNQPFTEGLPCSCVTCNGADTLCAVLDDIQVKTEDVTIRGQVYQIRTWNRMNRDGSFLEVREYPAWDDVSDIVKMQTSTKVLCKLAVTPSGCITTCQENKDLLYEFCRDSLIFCGHLLRKPVLDVMPYRSRFGYWKRDATSPNLVHLKHVHEEKIVATFQGDGDCERGEMLVPHSALDALWSSMMYRMIKFNPNSNRGEKEDARMDETREKTRLMMFLNPIRPSTFLRLQGTVPKW